MSPSDRDERRREVPPDPEILTMGEGLGVFLAGADVPLGRATGFELQVAGAELNVAVGLSRLGHRVGFLGRVGRDPIGRRVRSVLAGEGVDTTDVVDDPARPTGVLVRDTALGRPISVTYLRSGSAGSALSPDDLPEARIRSARVLHLSGVTAALSETAREACRAAVRTAVEAGVPVCFDPNVRRRLGPAQLWRSIVDEFCPLSTVVLTGADDLTACGIDAEPHTWLHRLGVAWAVVKDGARGASESHAGGPVVRVAARPTTVVDPVGAGDAFAAGWLSAWLRDLDAESRLTEAAVVAAAVVSSRGDLPGLMDAADRDLVLAGGQDVVR